MPTVEYPGHSISAGGLCPTQEKVSAIVEAPAPRNTAQLRSFLGMVNYYGKFLSNLSHTLAPLYQMLQKQRRWSWNTPQEEAFLAAKKQLTAALPACPLQPRERIDPMMRCIAIWSWDRQRKVQRSRSLSLPDHLAQLTEVHVCPAGIGGTGDHFCREEIQPISTG